jgi:hypothetical protein
LVPPFDSGDDFVGLLGPAEGAWVCVGFREETLNGGLEFHDGVEDATFYTNALKR